MTCARRWDVPINRELLVDRVDEQLVTVRLYQRARSFDCRVHRFMQQKGSRRSSNLPNA